MGRPAPCKALTLHCAVTEGITDPSLSSAIPSSRAPTPGGSSGVLLHLTKLPGFTPESPWWDQLAFLCSQDMTTGLGSQEVSPMSALRPTCFPRG